eukprot:c10095_g1_i1 orf=525-2138(-)
MTSDGRSTAAAINAAISSADQRHTAPEQRRWKGYWTRYWCFKSQKREKRIVPAARPHGASESAHEWPAQAVLALAPPSSPASFVNSSVQSPASFTLSLSAASAIMCSPGPPNTMFTIGPYAHETQLVSPPVFSTFTTEPSTAPFTPPPESAHLTTPSSPEVPYAAHYFMSSLEAKAAARETISPLSTSNLASPCDTPASYTPTSGHLYLRRAVRETISPRSSSTLASPCDTPASYTPTSRHLYPGGGVRETISPRSLASPSDTPASYTPTSSQLYLGSPISCLVSQSVEYCGKDTFLEEAIPAHSYTHSKDTVSAFPSFDPISASTFNHAPLSALILPCDSTSRPEGLPAAVIPESRIHGDSLKLNGHELNGAGDLVLDSEKELDLRHLQKLSNGSMPSEECNSGHFDISGAPNQSDVASSTSSMKEYEICTDGGKRFQNSSSCERDEKRECIFSTSRNEYCNAVVENAHHFKIADSSQIVEDAGDERLVQSLPAPDSDASRSVEDAGYARVVQSPAAPRLFEQDVRLKPLDVSKVS